MRRRLPPLEQIEAFIAAAEAPSFRVAAERCALSPAAFSRRVQAFGAFVGLSLFERRGSALQLSLAGSRCLAELKPAYFELRRATAAVCQGEESRRTVTLSLSHSLAVGWLIPRLDGFRAAHPDIELSLKAQRDASDIRSGAADLGLCFSDIDLSGLTSISLLDVTVAPAASPALAATIARGDRLETHRLLSVSHPPGLWTWWAREAGLPTPTSSPTTYDLMHAMYEVAAEGLGVALAATPTVWPHLDSGRLVPLDLPHAKYPGGYRLAAPGDRKLRRPVAALWRWLEAEAARTPDFAQARIAA